MSTTTWCNIIEKLQLLFEIEHFEFFLEMSIYKGNPMYTRSLKAETVLRLKRDEPKPSVSNGTNQVLVSRTALRRFYLASRAYWMSSAFMPFCDNASAMEERNNDVLYQHEEGSVTPDEEQAEAPYVNKPNKHTLLQL